MNLCLRDEFSSRDIFTNWRIYFGNSYLLDGIVEKNHFVKQKRSSLRYSSLSFNSADVTKVVASASSPLHAPSPSMPTSSLQSARQPTTFSLSSCTNVSSPSSNSERKGAVADSQNRSPVSRQSESVSNLGEENDIDGVKIYLEEDCEKRKEENIYDGDVQETDEASALKSVESEIDLLPVQDDGEIIDTSSEPTLIVANQTLEKHKQREEGVLDQTVDQSQVVQLESGKVATVAENGGELIPGEDQQNSSDSSIRDNECVGGEEAEINGRENSVKEKEVEARSGREEEEEKEEARIGDSEIVFDVEVQTNVDE